MAELVCWRCAPHVLRHVRAGVTTAAPGTELMGAARVLAVCEDCGKVLSAAAGFCELRRKPSGESARFCSIRCLHAWAEMRLGDAP